MNIKINGKGLLTAILLSSGLVMAQFVSFVDAKSAGGINIVEEAAPVGAIMMWGTPTPPSGWVELKGQSTASYPSLAAVYGSTLPDLRGEFVRGWDNGRGVDAGRSIGTFQADEFKSHTHDIAVEPDGSGGSGVITIGPHAKTTTRTTEATGGDETRPRNIALMYIIKAE